MTFKRVGADENGDFPPRVEQRLAEKFRGRLWSGEGAPSDDFGRQGDYYIDPVAGLLYGPRGMSMWPSEARSIVGRDGQDGQDGQDGEDGTDGANTEVVVGAITKLISDPATVSTVVYRQGRIVTIAATTNDIAFAANSTVELFSVNDIPGFRPTGARAATVVFGAGDAGWGSLAANGVLSVRRTVAGTTSCRINVVYFV